jgi:integrase
LRQTQLGGGFYSEGILPMLAPRPAARVAALQPHRARGRADAFARGLAKPADFVFVSESGGPLDHHNVGRRGLAKATAGANLPHLRWHDLRHLAASMLIAEGAPASYVAALLGHASPAITLSIYSHLFARAEHADRMRERMEAAFVDVLT